MDEKYIAPFHMLLNNVNDRNEICKRSITTHELADVCRSREDLMKIVGCGKRKIDDICSKLEKLNVIAERIVVDKGKKHKRYYMNPKYAQTAKATPLKVYDMFRATIDPMLHPFRVKILHGILTELGYMEPDNNSIEEDINNDNDDDEEDSKMDLFIESLKMNEEEVAQDNVKTEFNPFMDPQMMRKWMQVTKVTDEDEAGNIAAEFLCDNIAPIYYALNYQNRPGMRKANFTLETDMYFTPNLAVNTDTKPKNTDIIKFRSWYLDIDAGKDSDGHYFDMEVVENRKKYMRAIIDALPDCTYANETRNGYQIYFACDNVMTEEEWRKVENKLIEVVIVTDMAVKDPARLMRVPESMWHKAGKAAAAGCEPFKCRAYVAHRVRYSSSELIQQLDACAAEVAKLCDEYANAFNIEIEQKPAAKTRAKVVTMDHVATNARIEDIKNLTLDTFDIPAMTTTSDIKSYVKQQSLADFLGIDNPRSFCCVFHPDRHPSASIYNNATEDRYVCATASNTSSCPVSPRGWDIIDCVMHLANCDFVAAINYLCRVYNVTTAAAA